MPRAVLGCRARSSVQARVERIAQPVAEQVEGEHGHHDRDARCIDRVEVVISVRSSAIIEPLTVARRAPSPMKDKVHSRIATPIPSVPARSRA